MAGGWYALEAEPGRRLASDAERGWREGGEEEAMILMMGATGQIGGLVVADLRARGAAVWALVRDPARAEGLREQCVEIAVGDLSQPAWPPIWPSQARPWPPPPC